MKVLPSHFVVSGAVRADVVVTGDEVETWVRQRIRTLTLAEALSAPAELEPVYFRHRDDDDEAHVGFVAEDVPPLVAANDRVTLSRWTSRPCLGASFRNGSAG